MPKLGIWEKNRARKNRKGSIHFPRGKTLIEREKIFEPKVSTKHRLFLRFERIFFTAYSVTPLSHSNTDDFDVGKKKKF